MLRRIQRRLECFYALDASADVVEFVRELDDEHARETLLVREQGEDVELALLMPKRLLEPLAAEIDPDGLLQALEGVSHFVYLAERVRMGLPSTKLELELQAEVDKFVLLAIEGAPLARPQRDALCEKLFDGVRFIHGPESEDGERYRLANALAARYVRRLDPGSGSALRTKLRRFYRAGQTEKIHLAQAA